MPPPTAIRDPLTRALRRAHGWLHRLDPARHLPGTTDAQRSELALLREELDTLLPLLDADPALADTARALRSFRDALPRDATVPEDRDGRDALYRALAPRYEAAARAARRAGARTPFLRPTNHLRSAVHLLSGLAVVIAFETVFTPTTARWTAGAFTVWAWSLEAARRVSPTVNRWCMAFFGPIAREHEYHRVNAATWYGTALLVLAFTAYGPAGALGLLGLAIGDPVAGYVGRTYGTIRVLGEKSLEGSLAFALASAFAGYLYLVALHPEVTNPFALAVLTGITGAVVELLSVRLEDNFTIPVFTAWAAQLALLA